MSCPSCKHFARHGAERPLHFRGVTHHPSCPWASGFLKPRASGFGDDALATPRPNRQVSLAVASAAALGAKWLLAVPFVPALALGLVAFVASDVVQTKRAARGA